MLLACLSVRFVPAFDCNCLLNANCDQNVASTVVIPNTLPLDIRNGHSPLRSPPGYGLHDNVPMPDAPSDGEMFPSNPENMDGSDASNESMNAEEDAASANVDDDDESVNGVDAGMSSRHSSDDESIGGSEDAAGEDVAEFTMENGVDAPPSEMFSSSPGSKRGVKRKSSVDEEEYIRNNPTLYGLRRSGRARPTRRLDQESSASESDVAPPPKRRRPGRTSDRPSPVQMPESSSDSDSDAYEGPRRSRQGKKQRRNNQNDLKNSYIPTHGEVRFSTRRANKVCNYNEESDDNMFEDEYEEGTPGEWTYTVDDTTPAIDKILYHRFKEGVDLEKPDLGRRDCEYYTKWQGLAHYHATWETVDTLANCRGIRRLDNYIRREIEQEILFMRDPDVIPEEREKWSLDRERYIEKIDHFKQVERVIGSREVDGATEYYIKWKRLPYDGCTWEEGSLISNMAQAQIDAYLDRCSHPPISSRAESNPATRSKFEPIHTNPDFIQNGQLKEFQIKGVNFLAYNWVRGRNVVLADEMGLGKTVQTVAFINWLRHVRQQQGPFIVIVPLSTMPAWSETFDYWTPDVNYIVYSGPEPARRIIKDYELLADGNLKRPKFNVLLTTYEYVLQDASFLNQIKWQFMAIDEAHRLKNRDSQLYTKLLDFKSSCRLLITGTPVQNNLGELSALMDFLNPGVIEIDENMDLNSEAASAKLADLTQAIQPYMLRRTKSKVESELPPKSEKIIRVELSDVQLELYKNILTKNYDALNHGGKGPKPSLLNIMMELKKASNHPFMFWGPEEQAGGSTRREDQLKALVTSSGKMMVLDQLLTKLKNDGHRVLIFSQMVRMLNILANYMDARGFNYQRLDGTIAAGPRRLAIEHYNAPGSTDFTFLLSTRAGGLGINLMTADTVILFDSDWNPQADLQAMARAHRIGQTKPVSVYRLVSKDTVEEEVLERARNKLLLEFITIQRGVTDNEATSLKNKLAQAGHHVNEPTSFDDISRILKQRGQRMFEQSDNQKKLEELDIDAVLANAEEHKTVEEDAIEVSGGIDFINECQYVDVKFDDLSWDDIIPKEYLEKIKAEEELEAQRRPPPKEEPTENTNSNAMISDEREERKAKRRARQQVNLDAEIMSDAEGPDPSAPLSEKEYRHLIRAYLRYGDMKDRQEEIIKEARLVNRDLTVVKDALNEVIEKATALEQEENNRIRALEREGKSFTKKERKAILFDHKGVKRINAETIVSRPGEMRLLREATSSLQDITSFRIPEATKGADYSCSWGAREDGMLCLGIARHGYGAWTQIRDDPELGLSDKFFLDEHRVDRKQERLSGKGEGSKSPGAVHLVRRADYLISVLKAKASNGSNAAARKALENHHRNNKKVNSRNAHRTVSASPAPSLPRKGRESEKSRRRMQNRASRDSADGSHTPLRDHRDRDRERDRGKPVDSDKARRHSKEEAHRRRSDDRTPTGGDTTLRSIFKPIREHLRRVSQVTKENIPSKSQRVAELRRLLQVVGDFIHGILDGQETAASLEERLWDYCAITYWPNKGTPGSALLTMYEKIAKDGGRVEASN
ncbi:chromodomain helicase [Trichophyton violaceum]|uniref:Chromodomain helicase n=1 Tax=Trichophyton violaceum TaxID=34388 RepID=A0A178FD00_TRIVO|nr:chromodomain helicase [Trichophyton violaceum]